MNHRIAVALGAGTVALAAFVPALASVSTTTAPGRAGPVTVEIIGPDQTGFTPAAPVARTSSPPVVLSAETLARVRAAASPKAPPPAGPKRVTGLSTFLDVMQAGSGIGLAEIYGLAVSGFTTIVPTDKLPPQVVQGGFTVLAVPPKIFDQMKQPTLQFFASLRQAIAPLAAGNAAANALLTALSAALVNLGTNGKALVNPFDAQVVELGKFLLVLEEPA